MATARLKRNKPVARTITLPRVLDHQRDLLLSPARFKLAVCGRRWGKTTAGMLAAIKGHGPSPNYFPGVAAGKRIWWVAPNYPEIQASRIWVFLKKALRGAWESKSEVEREINLPNGGSIAVRSADEPNSLRGPGLDGLIIDEVAFLKEDVWKDVLRPALSDRQGWALLISTPNGVNWIKTVFDKAPTRDNWQRWQSPSWSNPLLTDAEIADLKEELGPRKFAQECGAEFISVEGALWPGEYFTEMTTEKWPDRFELSTIAVDPSMGRSDSGDPSAIAFVGLTGSNLYVDVDIERRAPSKLVDDTIRIYQRYTPNAVGFEGNAFQELFEPLFDYRTKEMQIPPLPLKIIRNHENKQTRIQRLDPYLDKGKLRLKADAPGTPTLIEQLQMFPLPDYHDDGPDALEMAIRLLHYLGRKRKGIDE